MALITIQQPSLIQSSTIIKAPPINLVKEFVCCMNISYENKILKSFTSDKQIKVISDIMVELAIKYSNEDDHYDYETALDGSWISWFDTEPRAEVFTRFIEIYA